MRAPSRELPIVFDGVTRDGRRRHDPRQHRAQPCAGRADGADRPERLGKDHAAARGDGARWRLARAHHLGRPGKCPAAHGARSCFSARRCSGAAPAPISASRCVRPASRARNRRAAPANCSNWSASDSLADRAARRLSGGEQQRLALARALARDPAVLFLDEPTASLDPTATKAVEDIIRAVSQRSIKVVMATHDLGEARRLAGDIVMLHRGRVVETGAAASFFDAPQTAEAQDVPRRRAACLIGNGSERSCRLPCSPPPADCSRRQPRIHRCAIAVLRRKNRSWWPRPPRRRIRPVRPHPAAVQGQDRNRREGGGAGHRPGARYRAPRRCRRRVRPRQACGGKVPGRRLWRQALSR